MTGTKLTNFYDQQLDALSPIVYAFIDYLNFCKKHNIVLPKETHQMFRDFLKSAMNTERSDE